MKSHARVVVIGGGVVGSMPLAGAPRIGLYQSWSANMDEGWTRWVLEQHGFTPPTR